MTVEDGPKAQPPATGRDRFFTFTKEQGLPDNVINNVQEDDFGCLWLSGLRGIYRVSRRQLNAVAAGRLPTVACTIFGEADGMLSSECNGGDNQPAGCKDRLGRIWFPTVQGVVMIDPKLARSAGDPPPVLVEQVKANGQVVFGDDLESSAPQRSSLPYRAAASAKMERSKLPRSDVAPYRLPAGTARALEIFYTANNFADPARIRFKYRLEGYDQDWLWDEQNRRTVSYANLKPGRYTFRVTACDSHGCWNEQGAQFAFYIEPFFWQTWPFYIAMGALALAAAMGMHHQRVARLRGIGRLEQERSLADERARIARDLHDDLGASLSRIVLLSEVASKEQQSGAKVTTQLARITTMAAQLVDNIGELVWATNSKYDNLASLAAYFREYAGEFFDADVNCHLDFPPSLPEQSLTAVFRRHLFLILKEALRNISKHSGATRIEVGLSFAPGSLELVIQDNGKGFVPPRGGGFHHGLSNMRERIASLQGNLDLNSAPGEGTRLVVRVPLPRE
jgi:signal transduction histidine kinase